MQSALRNRGFQAFIATYLLAMMADNIEHVISYWVAYQKFHSEALGGFAVLSHWLPFLGFSVSVGALNDRYDSRRIIQIGMALFITASLGWGYCFLTDSLTIPIACTLLVLHGCAGVLWQTSSQMLLYDIVGPTLLPSAVRLNATARSLGVLVGPAVGGRAPALRRPDARDLDQHAVLHAAVVVARPRRRTASSFGARPRSSAPSAALPISRRRSARSAACRCSRQCSCSPVPCRSSSATATRRRCRRSRPI